MLSRGVEAAREGTPQDREFLEYLLFNLVRKHIGQNQLFHRIGRNRYDTGRGNFSKLCYLNCSEEEKKMIRLRETRIRFFIQMELEACRDECQ